MTMKLNRVYFYTATVKDWIPLFQSKETQDILLGSLKHLVDKKKITLYGFVIMPNHIHLLWEMLAMNGKELPSASFMKFSSHEIQKQENANFGKEVRKPLRFIFQMLFTKNWITSIIIQFKENGFSRTALSIMNFHLRCFMKTALIAFKC